MKSLIAAVVPGSSRRSPRKKSEAADQLVAIGPPALPLVQQVLDSSWTSDAHGVGAIEAFMLIATRIREQA